MSGKLGSDIGLERSQREPVSAKGRATNVQLNCTCSLTVPAACFLLVALLACYLALKMEGVHPLETSSRIVHHVTPEYNALCNHVHCSLK